MYLFLRWLHQTQRGPMGARTTLVRSWWVLLWWHHNWPEWRYGSYPYPWWTRHHTVVPDGTSPLWRHCFAGWADCQSAARRVAPVADHVTCSNATRSNIPMLRRWGRGRRLERSGREREGCSGTLCLNIGKTMQCRYNAANFLQNPHNGHPIARPWGRDVGSLLWF